MEAESIDKLDKPIEQYKLIKTDEDLRENPIDIHNKAKLKNHTIINRGEDSQ